MINNNLNPNGKNIQMVLFYDENNEKTERIIKEWNLFETDCTADINVVKIKLSENKNVFSNYDVCIATDEHYPSILVLDKTNSEITRYIDPIDKGSLIDYTKTIKLLIKDCCFMNIVLVNHVSNITDGLDKMMDYYGKILEITSFTAGFQAIVVGVYGSDVDTEVEKWSLFLFALGFLFSMGAVLISFCANNYFTGIYGESSLFIARGCMKWQLFFYLADMFTISSLCTLMVAINLGIWSLLPDWQAYLFSIIVGIGFIMFFVFMYNVIKKQQKYDLGDGDIVQRNIYNLKPSMTNPLIPRNT